MEQELFSSIYNIKDGQGRIVYTIQAPCYGPAVPCVVWCFEEEFEVCMDDGISEIGRITRGWGDDFPDFDGDLGLEFETSDDNRVKALLLGVFFLIEFQYFKYGGNGVAYFFFMLVFILVISFVLSNGFGFFPQFNSPIIPDETTET
ncbi:phospholipid scramblase 3-like [Folsomia candida]|uniref:phospholipid scramblase 3-like n=1 Tax=Folsomia candida TaxID=158441 RepID=UPI001604BFF4|nr:phospholipid scramblase 3-like [Folsomia candida]